MAFTHKDIIFCMRNRESTRLLRNTCGNRLCFWIQGFTSQVTLQLMCIKLQYHYISKGPPLKIKCCILSAIFHPHPAHNS